MTARDPYGEIDLSGREEGEEEGLDLERVKETLGFVWRAPRRRPRLAALVFAVVASLGITVAVTMPRTYNSQVKLLAERDLVATNLTNPSRAVPRDAENLTRNVPDMILRRENIIALVKELNLIARWHASRPAALRLKDETFALLSGQPTEAEELRNMAQTLEKRMTVTADESTVTISVDWSDPQLAYELVSLVQKNFVESRYDSDVEAIQRAISALEDSSKTEAEQVDTALAAYQALQNEPAAAAAAAAANAAAQTSPNPNAGSAQAPVFVPRPAAPAALPDPDLTKALDDKRREIRASEDDRQRQLASLKQQLLQAQLTLTPLHPTVIALQEQFNTLSEPSPELARLKAEEAALMSQIAPAASAGGPPALVQRFWAPPAAPTAAPAPNNSPYREDPANTLAHSRLEAAIHRYQEVMAHLESARIELRVTRTASKYSVITPAEVPRSPKKPIAPLVAIGSVFAAFLFAFVGAAAADWQAGRVLEAWEVRRRLKLDVLGHLDLPL